VWKHENRPDSSYITLAPPEKFLLNYLENHPSVTQAEYMELARIPRNKAENILVHFILMKIIRMEFTENLTFFTLHPSVKLADND
jgi:hypothetical protein